MIGVNIGVAAPVAFFPFSGWKDSFLGDLHAHGPRRGRVLHAQEDRHVALVLQRPGQRGLLRRAVITLAAGRAGGGLRPGGGDGLPLAAPRGRGAADPARRRRGLRAAGRWMGVPLLHPWANRLAEWRYEALGRRVDLEPLAGDRGRARPQDRAADPRRAAAAVGGRRAGRRRGSSPSSRRDDGRRVPVPAPDADRGRAVPGRAADRDDARGARGRGAGRVRLPPVVHACPARRARTTRSSCPRCAGSRSTSATCRRARASGWPPFAGALGRTASSTTPSTSVADGAAFAVAGGGRRIAVRFDAGYPCAQVFAPPGKDLVCFEPMTAPGDALRTRRVRRRRARPALSRGVHDRGGQDAERIEEDPPMQPDHAVIVPPGGGVRFGNVEFLGAQRAHAARERERDHDGAGPRRPGGARARATRTTSSTCSTAS